MQKYCVYKTTNPKSGKYYFGKTTTKNVLENGYKGSGVYIKNCESSGIKLETEIWATFELEKAAYKYEKMLTFAYWENDKLMNVVLGGRGGNLNKGGYKLSEEAKKNISKSKMGSRNPMFGKPSPNRGISHTEETKRKISEARKGQFAGEKHHNSKLTKEDVLSMRNDFDKIGYNREILSEKYGVSKETVSDIYHERTWRHI